MLGMRFGLGRMHGLLDELGSPQRRDSIHIVGSNGKTSTAHLAAAVLAGQGRRVGLYTSPDVLGWNERIVVDGETLPLEAFASAVGAVRGAAGRLGFPPEDGVTQFEVLTAAAFVAFAEAGCDSQVLEAGLGGRHDATNVLSGERTSVALTNVSLEHMDLLGRSEEAIAEEKLAVSAPGGTVVVGPMSSVAARAVETVGARHELDMERVGREITVQPEFDGVLVRTPRGRYHELPLGLRGAVQRGNLAVAIATTERFLGGPISDVEALHRAVAETRVPGRLELFDGRPSILVDGAHNPAGMAALAAAIPEILSGRRTVALLSILGDKDVNAMADTLVNAVDVVVATSSSHARAIPADRLAERLRVAGLASESVAGPSAALAVARERAGADGAVVVCGSLYLLRDLYPLITGRTAAVSGEPLAMLAPAAHRRAAP